MQSRSNRVTLLHFHRSQPYTAEHMRLLGLIITTCFLLAPLSGCQDDNIVLLLQPGTLTICANGGHASSSGAGAGDGGTGGNIEFWGATEVVIGDLGAQTPSFPALPIAPLTGTILTELDLATDISQTGNLLVQGAFTTSGVGVSRTIESLNGDVVISGSVTGQDIGAAAMGIDILAPLGTVFISGSVITRGIGAGDGGGGITISGQRVVITGLLDARGTTSTGPGGNGGVIDISVPAGGTDIFIVTGSLLTQGGNGGTVGGIGGDVTCTAQNRNYVFGTANLNGGSVTGTSNDPIGGAGGNLLFTSANDLVVVATISADGGLVQTTGVGGTGGDGGILALETTVSGDVRVFGSLFSNGGTATATGAGLGLNAGNGGNINLGTTGGGVPGGTYGGKGPIKSNGGNGENAGQDAGPFTAFASRGPVKIGSHFVLTGGLGLGTGPSTGGNGGTCDITSDTALVEAPVILRFLSSIDTSGGWGTGAGAGGGAGPITIIAGSGIEVGGNLTSRGGAAQSGIGGNGSNLTIDATNGDLNVTSNLDTSGGDSSSGTGGNAAVVDLIINGIGNLNLSGSITSMGGQGTSAGVPAAVSLTTGQGDIHFKGTITTSGTSSNGAPSNGANIDLATGVGGGSVRVEGTLIAEGGGSTATGPLMGSNGGTITLTTQHATGKADLNSSCWIRASGGAATGGATGGVGGLIQITTLDAPIDLFGTLTTTGGASGSGTGGGGGRVVVESDSNNDDSSGTITLTGTIDVSGGTGMTQGNAASNGSPLCDNHNPPPATIAIIFDTDGADDDGLGESLITNMGVIRSNGGAQGGDVVFDGDDGSAGPPAEGTQSRSGTTAGDYCPN